MQELLPILRIIQIRYLLSFRAFSEGKAEVGIEGRVPDDSWS
jgi:hypothetical protein